VSGLGLGQPRGGRARAVAYGCRAGPPLPARARTLGAAIRRLASARELRKPGAGRGRCANATLGMGGRLCGRAGAGGQAGQLAARLGAERACLGAERACMAGGARRARMRQP